MTQGLTKATINESIDLGDIEVDVDVTVIFDPPDPDVGFKGEEYIGEWAFTMKYEAHELPPDFGELIDNELDARLDDLVAKIKGGEL